MKYAVFAVKFGDKPYMEDCIGEDVTLEDINGDVNDLIGEEILEAREDTNSQVNEEGSLTWTFYTIKSRRGTVVIRWYGTSNGCYSEAVDVTEILEEDDGI